jgi:hypothetical protein
MMNDCLRGLLLMHKLQSRYAASKTRLKERAIAASAEAGVDVTQEANVMAERFGVSRKKRAVSEYTDVARYLLNNYPSELAYFVAVELNEKFEPRLGYPPIGQIMVAVEDQGSEAAASWIGCALRNFPRIETAQLAFGVIKSCAMRALVQTDLAAEDEELAKYISSGEIVAPPPKPSLPGTETTPHIRVEHQPGLSDGIERMPRLLTDAERRGDRLFLHLQVVSDVLLFLSPILGGVLRGWTGTAIGLVVGLLVWVWMRHSMGLRGWNRHDGFFIRMRERANGAPRGFLEAVIEKVRQRPFTQAQCAAITQAWDETLQRLEATTSEEEKRSLINAFDAQIKRISYGQDG